MAIKMVYEELVNLQTALTTVADLSEKEPFPIELDMWFLRLIKKSKAPMVIYTELRDKLLREFGTEIFAPASDKRDKDGKPVNVSTGRYEMTTVDAKEMFNKKLIELNKQECEIEGNVFVKPESIFEMKDMPRLSLRTKLFLAPVVAVNEELEEVNGKEEQEEEKAKVEIPEKKEEVSKE